MSIARGGANESLFYFGSDDGDVVEIGGRVPRRRRKERVISQLIMRYRVCLMFRQ